jgi:hypothetical protein
MSLDDLRSRASKTNRLILLRACVAGLAVLIFIGFLAETLTWKVSTLVTKADIEITQCVFLMGAAYGFWQLVSLLRRAIPQSLTEGAPSACAAFYRSELERQRRSCRRSAAWVSLAFSGVWAWVLVGTQHSMAMQVMYFRVLMIAIWVLFVPFWVYQNMNLARGAQRELDRLNATSDREPV